MDRRPVSLGAHNDVKIRHAHLQDLEALAQLKYELDLYHKNMPIWPPECDMREARRTMKTLLKDRRHAIFVAESSNKEIVGIVTTRVLRRKTLHPEYRRVGEIGILHVQEASRRQGVGKCLVEACIDHFDKRGVKHVTLRSVVYNDISDRFWRSLSLNPALYVRSSTVDNVRNRLKAMAGIPHNA